jgi:MFS family permease
MPPVIAAFIVFFCSGAVLVLEILAARILAPYVGVTLETYTGIIATILAGISLGSWYGGRLADRVEPRRLLGPVILLGGLVALFAVPLVTFFGELLRGGGNIAILILALVGFFVPATVLSAVTPIVVKLQLRRLEETGRTVGTLSAIGTAGAILGTLLTGFVLIRFFPNRPIVLVVGGTLVVLGVVVWGWLWPADTTRRPALATLAVGGALLTALAAGPCDRETTYYCARVVADGERPGGRVLVLDTLRHSYVDLEDPTYLDFGYMQLIADVIDSSFEGGEPLVVLHVGGGGFTMPQWLEATRRGSRNVVLELDGELVELARAELGLERAPRTRIEVGDARLLLVEEPAGAYDVVIGDAFGGLAVPWHLTTREFAAEIRARLAPGGVYVLNVIDHPPLAFARAELATLAAVFEHVAVLAEPARLQRAEGGNLVLAASDAPIDDAAVAAHIAARGGTEAVARGATLDTFVGEAGVLRDDYAPVDQLLTPRPVRGTPVR